jgi:hypothetical protein
MFRSIRIDNFRAIKAANIRRLKRLNLVTGRNGGGKTSLLEAIFLNAGAANSTLIFFLSAFRGDAVLHPDNDRIFRSCFHDMQEDRHIHIHTEELRQARGRSRLLTIEAQTRTESPPNRSIPRTLLSGVKFRFKGPSGEAVSEASINFTPPQNASHIQITTPDNKDIMFAKFLSPYYRDVLKETHDELVSAVKDKRLPLIIGALSIVEEGINDITPLTENAQPNIYLDIGKPHLLPISVLGSGFFHILRLSLALLISH